jgi:osmotically-inducible protein OsmY
MNIRRITPPPLAAALWVAAALLAGCDKTTTVEKTPTGSVTTTTIAPSADASAVIGKIDASLQQAASAVQSSAAASQALTKVGDAIEDGAITAAVKTALLADPDVKSLHIDVDTKAHIVALNGSVPSDDNRIRAEHIAQGTNGVRAVENHLTVASK